MKDVTIGYVLEKIASVLSKREFQIRFNNNRVEYYLYDNLICYIQVKDDENILVFVNDHQLEFMTFKKMKVMLKLLSKLDGVVVKYVNEFKTVVNIPWVVDNQSLEDRRAFKEALIENGLSEYKQFRDFCDHKFD